jgi:hypothetical protein
MQQPTALLYVRLAHCNIHIALFRFRPSDPLCTLQGYFSMVRERSVLRNACSIGLDDDLQICQVAWSFCPRTIGLGVSSSIHPLWLLPRPHQALRLLHASNGESHDLFPLRETPKLILHLRPHGVAAQTVIPTTTTA